jgi:hypothetical protein
LEPESVAGGDPAHSAISSRAETGIARPADARLMGNPQHHLCLPGRPTGAFPIGLLKRAKGRYESCGRPQGKIVAHLGHGRSWDEEAVVSDLPQGRPYLTSLSCLSARNRSSTPSTPRWRWRPHTSTTICRTTRQGTCAHSASAPTCRTTNRSTSAAGPHLQERRAVGDLFGGRYE